MSLSQESRSLFLRTMIANPESGPGYGAHQALAIIIAVDGCPLQPSADAVHRRMPWLLRPASSAMSRWSSPFSTCLCIAISSRSNRHFLATPFAIPSQRECAFNSHTSLGREPIKRTGRRCRRAVAQPYLAQRIAAATSTQKMAKSAMNTRNGRSSLRNFIEVQAIPVDSWHM